MILLNSWDTFLILRAFQTCGQISTINLKLILFYFSYLELILNVNVYNIRKYEKRFTIFAATKTHTL